MASSATLNSSDLSSPEQRYQTLAEPRFADLAHIPGPPESRRSMLYMYRVMRDPLHFSWQGFHEYGPVSRGMNFSGWGVTLVGPEAQELILVNRDEIVSSEQGWHTVLYQLFPKGLMLMDNPQHRNHRRALSVAFKAEPMRHYFGGLQRGIARGLQQWGTQLKFYPAIKQLTLDLAGDAFLGLPWGPEAQRINTAFIDMVQASVTVIRKPIWGSPMWRGVRGRQLLCEFFQTEIPKRRGSDGDDFFSQFCNARNDAGELLSDQEVIDHMNFLMMAAHDTLTSSFTSAVYFLAANPQWMNWACEEVDKHPDICYDNLDDFERLEMVFKEAMRLNPPVPIIPRRALKPISFGGYDIPAGSMVSLNPMLTHRLPELWDEPEVFNPERFTTEENRKRHRYTYIPYGGGAHMCLGLHFAYMQAKVFLHALLRERRPSLEPGYEPNWARFPIVRPRDKLPIQLNRR